MYDSNSGKGLGVVIKLYLQEGEGRQGEKEKS